MEWFNHQHFYWLMRSASLPNGATLQSLLRLLRRQERWTCRKLFATSSMAKLFSFGTAAPGGHHQRQITRTQNAPTWARQTCSKIKLRMLKTSSHSLIVSTRHPALFLFIRYRHIRHGICWRNKRESRSHYHPRHLTRRLIFKPSANYFHIKPYQLLSPRN